MKILLNIYYFFRSIYLRGLINTLRIIFYETKAEKKYKINTTGIKASNSALNFHYQGANYFILEKPLKKQMKFYLMLFFLILDAGRAEHVLLPPN